MKQNVYLFNTIDELTTYMTVGPLAVDAVSANATLVQIYSMPDTPALAQTIARTITSHMPRVTIIGASTVGEVVSGHALTGCTLIVFTHFISTTLVPISAPCVPGEEQRIGSQIGEALISSGQQIQGVLVLNTPLSMEVPPFLAGLSIELGRYPVFGGGAGDYAAMANSWVMLGDEVYRSGAVAVALCGEDLHVELRTGLGWHPLSKEMTVTSVDGLRVLTIDDKPAVEVYQQFVEVPDGVDLSLVAAEFPMLVDRGDNTFARVPIGTDADKSLIFMADMVEGDTFRIGFGDPVNMVREARHLHADIQSFSAQGILAFVCGCRRYLMQDDAQNETIPFETLAPTGGFYTYGEFCSFQGKVELLNATMLIVALREGAGITSVPREIPVLQNYVRADVSDPYARQHARVVSSLVRFIGAVTSELEAANRDLNVLAVTDRLTKLCNRVRIEHVLERELSRARRYGEPLSVVMVDVDHFKRVNDEHGHGVGDAVLVQLAAILRESVRITDTVGRWGGEEFVIVLPGTDAQQAVTAAEKVRAAVESTRFPTVGTKTASFGVASLHRNESVDSLMARADTALYAAKSSGRNRVECADMELTVDWKEPLSA